MKKTFTILTLAILLPLFASAQYGRKPVSIISHLSGGYGGFMGKSSATRIDHWMGAVGAEAKIGWTSDYSLLIGLDYQFRYMNTGYTSHHGNYGSSIHNAILRGHYLRVPVRLEYDRNWFYAAFGPYLEKGFGNMPDKDELFGFGVDLELGGRLKLNRVDHLRIGLLTSAGRVLVYEPSYSFSRSHGELNFMLRVGYEHRL